MGEGEGYTLNVGLPGGNSDADYGMLFEELFLPVALRYSEDLDYVAYDLSVEDNDMRTLRTGLREVAEGVGLEVSSSPKTTRSRLVEPTNDTEDTSATEVAVGSGGGLTRGR